MVEGESILRRDDGSRRRAVSDEHALAVELGGYAEGAEGGEVQRTIHAQGPGVEAQFNRGRRRIRRPGTARTVGVNPEELFLGRNVAVFEVVNAEVEAGAAAQVEADAAAVGKWGPAHAVTRRCALERREGIRSRKVGADRAAAHSDELLASQHEFAQAGGSERERAARHGLVRLDRREHDAAGIVIKARAFDRAVPAFRPADAALDGAVPPARTRQPAAEPAGGRARVGDGNLTGGCIQQHGYGELGDAVVGIERERRFGRALIVRFKKRIEEVAVGIDRRDAAGGGTVEAFGLDHVPSAARLAALDQREHWRIGAVAGGRADDDLRALGGAHVENGGEAEGLAAAQPDFDAVGLRDIAVGRHDGQGRLAAD